MANHLAAPSPLTSQAGTQTKYNLTTDSFFFVLRHLHRLVADISAYNRKRIHLHPQHSATVANGLVPQSLNHSKMVVRIQGRSNAPLPAYPHVERPTRHRSPPKRDGRTMESCQNEAKEHYCQRVALVYTRVEG